MTRPPARATRLTLVAAAAALAFGGAPAALLAAQETPGTFSLPPGTPAPTPTPAGPSDERAGVAIPPRAVPTATPSAAPTVTPVIVPQPQPTATLPATIRPAPGVPVPVPARTGTAASPAPGAGAPAATASAAPQTPATSSAPPITLPPALPSLPSALPDTAAPAGAASDAPGLPSWWPYAAGGLGALVLLGGAALLRRRRKPKVLRLAAPSAATASRTTDAEPDEGRLDLMLEVTGATRSLMMFTLSYRLTIANRGTRAVNDLSLAVQIACARATAGANGAAPGAAQALGEVARIGPGQSRSITGEVQLPLAAIQPLRQGLTPLFVPLVHVTLEGEGQRALTRTFVVGPRSASGRVHPIPLDQPPGGIAGLVAQSVAIPPASAAA